MGSSSIAASILGDVERQRRLMVGVAGVRPAFDAFQSQQEQRNKLLASFSKSPALEAFAAQKKPTDALLGAVGKSGALDAYATKSSDTILKAIGGSGLFDVYTRKSSATILKAIGGSGALEAFTGRNGKWLEQVQKTVENSAFFAPFGAQQKERHHQLLAAVGKSPAIEQAFRSWKVTLPPGMAERMASYQARVLADVIVDSPPYVGEDGFGAPWFGEESWSQMVFHLIAILRCAEWLMAAMVAARGGLKAPIPMAVLYLLGLAIATGELAAHFAEPAAKRRDELSDNS